MNPRKDIKVVVLDLDGVLYDGPSATRPLAQALGIEDRLLAVLTRVVKQKMTFEESLVEGAKVWTGVPVDGTLDPLVHTLPLMAGAEDTVARLKECGYRVGCVSSGVSQFFMKPFRERLDLDFAVSNTLGESEGKHSGEVLHIMGRRQKAETMRNYMAQMEIPLKCLASVGDGENDIDLFKTSGFSIAFNPVSEAVSRAATVALHSKDLRDVLPHLTLGN